MSVAALESTGYRIIQGDCLEVMAGMPEGTTDAIVTDPPYGISFMGSAWDTFNPADTEQRVSKRDGTGPASDTRDGRSKGRSASAFANRGGEAGSYDFSRGANAAFQAWCEAWGREALRLLKPGGHLLASGGTRTFHRLTAGLEDAGFEIRDCHSWLFAQGFPKSLNLHGEWEGWGTALKPGWEPIVMGRKPLNGTVAANVREHGTGALNIDACRLCADGQDRARSESVVGLESNRNGVACGEWRGVRASSWRPEGRWPANTVLSHDDLCVRVGERRIKAITGGTGNHAGHVYGARSSEGEAVRDYADGDGLETTELWACVPGCPVRTLDEQSGISRSTAGKPRSGANGHGWGMTATGAEYADVGGASRFFYTAKASRAERNAGLADFPERPCLKFDPTSAMAHDGRRGSGVTRNHHPTVKPLELMRWLVRLVTPPGGRVLDPFAGAGTTGIACVLEGFEFVGIEREPEYVALAEARIAWWAVHPEGVSAEAGLSAERDRQRVADSGQSSLFGTLETAR